VGGEEGGGEGGAEHGTADEASAGTVTIAPPTQVSPIEEWIDPSSYQPTSLGEGVGDDQGAWASPTSTAGVKSATATATAAADAAATGAVATGTPVSAGTSVATTASTPGWDHAAETELIAMGFPRAAVKGALRASGGDKHAAVDMLLSGG
jgi:hypothetical protein